MAQKRWKALSPAQKHELWRRWRQGEHLTEISRSLGYHATSLGKSIAARGGFAPPVRRRAARSLSLVEREEISRGLSQGSSLRQIAQGLDRAPSTVSREVRRHGGKAQYRATRADRRAWDAARRPKRCRLAQCARLRVVVSRKLCRQWSPQQIAAWLVERYPRDQSMRVSHETIYRTLFIQARGALKQQLLMHLRTGRSMRRPLPSLLRKRQHARIPDAISIRERPAEAEDRAVPGHWEGDLLVGKAQTQIATLVERHSRYVALVRVPRKDTATVIGALKRQILKLPAHLRKSLTWDRGLELAAHREFTIATDVKVYFCDPRSPWQRGSNENTNGLLRQYLPKTADLSQYTQAQLNRIADRLNERPRQTLGWKSPARALRECVASTD